MVVLACLLLTFDIVHENTLNAHLVQQVFCSQAVVVNTVYLDSVEDEEAHLLMLNSLAADSAAENALAAGYPAEVAANAKQKILDRAQMFCTVVQNRHLHDGVSIQRTAAFDLPQQRFRLENLDTRDLNALAQEHGLSDLTMLTFDRTKVEILRPDACVDLVEKVDKLAVKMEGLTSIVLEVRELELGLIPTMLLEMPLVEIQPHECELSQLIVRGREVADGPVLAQAVVSIGDGYRVVKFERFNHQGLAFRIFEASDYRDVGPARLPFHTVHQQSFPSMTITETREVSSFELDAAISDEMFEIPSGWRIQNWSLES